MPRIINEAPADRLLKCLEFEDRSQMVSELAEDPDFQEILGMPPKRVEAELEQLGVDHQVSLERSMGRLNFADPAYSEKSGGATVAPEATTTGGLRRFTAAPALYHYGLAAGIVLCVLSGCAATVVQWRQYKAGIEAAENINSSLVQLVQQAQSMEGLLDQQVKVSNLIDEKLTALVNEVKNNTSNLVSQTSYIEKIGYRLEKNRPTNDIMTPYKIPLELTSAISLLNFEAPVDKPQKASFQAKALRLMDEKDARLQSAMDSYYKNLLLSLSVKRASMMAQTEK